jgi:hypothetical protein
MDSAVHIGAVEIVKVDSEFGAKFGFTSVKFLPHSYLWRQGDNIIVSFIAARHPGNGDFSKLIKNLEASGYNVLVPNPSGMMKPVLKHWGYKPEMVWDGELEDWIEIWKR